MRYSQNPQFSVFQQGDALAFHMPKIDLSGSFSKHLILNETEFFLQNSVSSRSQSGFKVMVESTHHGQLRIDNHGNHFIT